MNSRIISIFAFLCFVSLATAQNSTDALRYSMFEFGGTARSVGTGGALGALGADFSVLSTNPAGLGWYRRSEFVFTPGITSTNAESVLLSGTNFGFADDNRTVFNISSLGTVIASRPRRNPDWRTFNFAIGFNRVADFNERFTFSGQSVGSIVDRFQEIANSEAGLNDFESEIAFNAEALYDFDDDGFYNTDFELNPEAIIDRQQTVISKGSISEMGLSLSANYQERILIGATLGLPFVNFTEEKRYRETDRGDGPDGNVPFFDDLEYREQLTTTGIGVNLKMGIIIRPNQSFRLGVAVHTPTAYRLEDNYFASMTYDFTDDGQAFTGRDSLDGLFEYRLRTPWRIIGSAGLILGKTGFLSGEVEWTDYTNNRFNFGSFNAEEVVANDSIATTLSSAMNIRLGGELVYEIFRFRAGLGLQYSPYANDNTLNNTFSFGLGLREKSFFMDFAYRLQTFAEGYIPYLTSQAPQQLVDNELRTNQFLLTFGFKF